jgi:hypothetical protein
LLRPGGRLWLSQPNLDAAGLKRFGESWRGLETPRHLTMFSFDSLTRLLTELGFAEVQRPGVEYWEAPTYYRQSLAMAADLDPYVEPPAPGWDEGVAGEAQAATQTARRDPMFCESLTLVAVRPKS